MAEAEDRLKNDLKAAVNCVNKLVTVPLTQNEFDSLVSWTYNLGCGTLRKSKVLEYLNDSNYDFAAQHMRLYDKAGGQVIAGLTKRRMQETRLFESA